MHGKTRNVPDASSSNTQRMLLARRLLEQAILETTVLMVSIQLLKMFHIHSLEACFLLLPTAKDELSTLIKSFDMYIQSFSDSSIQTVRHTTGPKKRTLLPIL
jgi:hypothetical protein